MRLARDNDVIHALAPNRADHGDGGDATPSIATLGSQKISSKLSVHMEGR
jgi:hypothetical protein